MDVRLLGLLTKIIVLVIVFPVCQLGCDCEFKFQCAAQEFPPALPPFPGADSPGPGLPPANPPPESPGLPDNEVEALRQIVSSLVPTASIIKTSACDDQDQFGSYVTINCSDAYSNPDHQRHIVEITAKAVPSDIEIPADVAQLTYLQKLDLSRNKLHGSIPDQLGDLSNLVELDLSQNLLTGTIPLSLGNLKKLQYLFLGQNLLSGKIPPTLGNLSSLLRLGLRCNQLSGDIPPQLGNLSQLKRLILNENELTGRPPPELGKLSNLTSLLLSANKLRGELPKEYEKLSNLQIFQVGGNNLSGNIPRYIAKWENLFYLNLIGNNFEGRLPKEIFNMPNLEYLLVSDLNNQGIAFPESANLESIYTLILRNCNIQGVIPSYIANWSSIENLDLSFNNLIGGVPYDFENQSLYRLFLTGNKLNGTFPTWINKTVQIMGDLSYNSFTFPEEPQMDFGYNNSMNQTKINIEPRNRNFGQEIMDEHCHGKKSKYHSLFINAGGEEINIGRNHYEADNSTSNFYVSPAYNWAYSCNGYFLGKSTNSSDFISNAKSAVNSEDASLYSKARLCPLSLKYYGFCLHKGSYNVELHFSEIVFSEDEDLSSSGKRMFDIYIQGKQKRKDFNIKEKARGANKKCSEPFTVDVPHNILEIHLVWSGKGSLSNPTSFHGPLISAISVTPNFKVGGLSTTNIVVIVLAAVLALLLLLALMWRMGWIGDRELRVNKVTLGNKSYTLKQVKDATRNFSPRNEIGKGRFGTVYKAELPDQIVAVKKLSPEAKQEIGQIGTEVYALKQLNENENVVKLLDCYSKRDLQLLIYEYMEKGSLERVLFDPNSDHMQLDWPTRIDICLGTAKGLKYLHEDNKSHKIVHRNIKPSNILLDGNLKAKVADFGLAKLYDEENPYKFIQEKGTAVYMAPEYATSKAITDKVDVFSFGIVMLQIVSRQTIAKYEENQETIFLLDKAFVSHRNGRLFDLVDANMDINRDMKKQAIETLELAMKCVDQSPTLRPTMSQVVTELQQIISNSKS